MGNFQIVELPKKIIHNVVYKYTVDGQVRVGLVLWKGSVLLFSILYRKYKFVSYRREP